MKEEKEEEVGIWVLGCREVLDWGWDFRVEGGGRKAGVEVWSLECG
jgi:hypothetical protein